jgi:hypothetical protein
VDAVRAALEKLVLQLCQAGFELGVTTERRDFDHAKADRAEAAKAALLDRLTALLAERERDRAELARLREALAPLALLGLKALEACREGGDWDGGDIQDEAERLGVVVQTPVGPGRYCETGAECICAECEADFCYRDSPSTTAARAALPAGAPDAINAARLANGGRE